MALNESEVKAIIKEVMANTKHVNRPLVTVQLIMSIAISIVGVFGALRFINYYTYQVETQATTIAEHTKKIGEQDTKIASINDNVNKANWGIDNINKSLEKQGKVLDDIQRRPWQ